MYKKIASAGRASFEALNELTNRIESCLPNKGFLRHRVLRGHSATLAKRAAQILGTFFGMLMRRDFSANGSALGAREDRKSAHKLTSTLRYRTLMATGRGLLEKAKAFRLLESGGVGNSTGAEIGAH